MPARIWVELLALVKDRTAVPKPDVGPLPMLPENVLVVTVTVLLLMVRMTATPALVVNSAYTEPPPSVPSDREAILLLPLYISQMPPLLIVSGIVEAPLPLPHNKTLVPTISDALMKFGTAVNWKA